MSVRIMSAVFAADFSRISEKGRVSAHALKLLMLALADHAADDGSGVYPSAATMAKKTNLTVRQVRAALAVLRERGLLAAEGYTEHGTVRYRIVLDALGALAEAEEDDADASTPPEKFAGGGCKICRGGVQNLHPNRQ